MLEIVHLSTSDREGGSARSARRIHDGIRAMGHRSHMLVGFQSGHDADVETVHGGGGGRLADRIAEETTKRIGLQYLWYPSGRRITRHRWLQNADVIQLYNSHGGYLSHRILPALARRAPIVWRLSDMWAMTGHCAYSGACGRWQHGCGQCPDLAAYPALPFDTSALLWRIKRRIYAQARPVVVAPSRWIERIARSSPLFDQMSIHRIQNGVDRSIFRPMSKPAAREVLDLPRNQPLVLYCAQVVTNNARKGSPDAIAACNHLAAQCDADLLLVGVGGEGWQSRVPQRVHARGYIADERLLAAAYAAADVMIAPSVVENLPNAILESMACGTPVVAYDAGGITDVIQQQKTGWLVPVSDVRGLAAGMASLLADAGERERIARNALALIASEFDSAREARSFVDLYTSIRRVKRLD